MDIEREFEQFVGSLGNPDAPREEHRRPLRRQVLAAAESTASSMSEFKFNPKLDESQFSLDIPKDYEVVVKTNFAAKDVSEDDFVLLLRAWAGGNGGVFPDSLLDIAGWFKAAAKYDWSKEKQDEKTMEKAISRAFFRLGSKDWVYRGKGVKLGSEKEAVFWTPSANGQYRVIYGDLSIRQADKKDLPQ